MQTEDKAGEKYWTKVWEETPMPDSFDFTSKNINHYPNALFHNLFETILKDKKGSNIKLLEIGCGNSVFLSYFSKNYGYEVYGIDYSAVGCEQTRKILIRDGLIGTIVQADAFAPPAELLGKFDVVCSFGVVEHFENTSETIYAFSKFLKPGGILITSIPNLAGVTGILQKYFNKPVYDIHVPMDKTQLNDAISRAGLLLTFSTYFLPISFAVTLEGIDGKKIPGFRIKKFILIIIRTISKLIWLIERSIHPLPAKKLFSGGIMTAAIKN
ncbi:MAG: class I SAM-dependent methyltransferase [Bacteroidia bacterium]